MNQSLTQIIQSMVLEGAKPAKRIAQEMGKPYPTLLREINPYDSGAKVGIESLVPLMRSTGSMAPLEHLARCMNCLLVPVNTECATSWQAVPEALDALDNASDLSRSLRRALVQGSVTAEELDRIEKTASAIASAALTLVERLRGLAVLKADVELDKAVA